MGETGIGDPVEIRFERKCSQPTAKGCIEWMGARDKNGYGRIKPFNKKRMRVHRYSYERFIGPIPEGMFVCHHCDNPPCVNPKHLFLGTNIDNILDSSKKGRRSKNNLSGCPMEMLPNSKLSTTDVLQIRKLLGIEIKCTQIARWYGVHSSTIYAIRDRKTWYHI